MVTSSIFVAGDPRLDEGKFVKFFYFFKTYFGEFEIRFSILFSDYEIIYFGE